MDSVRILAVGLGTAGLVWPFVGGKGPGDVDERVGSRVGVAVPPFATELGGVVAVEK